MKCGPRATSLLGLRPSLILLAGLACAGTASAQCNKLISLSSGGAQGNGHSPSAGSIDASPDGTFVAFASVAENLVAGTSPFEDIFLRDVVAGTTRLVAGTALTDGASGQEGTRPLAVSGDGRYVTFGSRASNLVPGVADPNGAPDIFVVDMSLGTTTVVSAKAGTGGMHTANFDSYDPDVSGDGQYVVFSSAASDLPGSPPYGGVKVYRYRIATGAMTWISVPGIFVPGGGNFGTNYEPSIDADGDAIAFTGTARITHDDHNPGFDIFVRDLSGPWATTTLVSVQPHGQAYFGNCSLPSISGDGRRVAFLSDIPRLTSDPAPVGMVMVYWRDLNTGQTFLASKTSGGVPASEHCASPYISANGRYIAFLSGASNLPGANGLQQVYVHDTQVGTTQLVSQNSSLQTANGSCWWSTALDSGSTCFSSYASNLSPTDTNGFSDVFLRDLSTSCP